MLIKSLTALIFVLLLGVVVFVYLNSSGILQKTKISTSTEKSVTIGLSLGTNREERWDKDIKLFTERAESNGAKVVVQVANNDAARQTSQAEDLIAQGVDVLVVVPSDGKVAAKIVELAHQANIKVIAYDRMILDSNLDYYVSFDSEEVGRIQAQGVVAAKGSGDFAYIGGSPTDNNATLLKKGSMEVLAPKIQSKEINIVVDSFTPDWKADEAYKTIKTYLQTGKTLDGVVAANDGTAGGVIQALQEFNLAGKVPVSGQDAELAALRRVVAGTQTVTVYKPIKTLAYQAADSAFDFATNKKVKTNNTVNNGQVDVPSFLIKPVGVTKANIQDTVIKDGFHTSEEVYGKK